MGAKVKRSKELLVDTNGEETRRKKLSIHDLRKIKPLTPSQEETFHSWYSEQNMFLHGTAGTGKTFIALHLALREVLNKETPHKKIIIIRSAAPTREIGYLPGSEDDKLAVYEKPYHHIFAELTRFKTAYEKCKETGMVEFLCTSFIRGITLDDSIIVVDECQNMTDAELNTIMTRVGENSRIIFCGDINQNDLLKHSNDKSALPTYKVIFNKMKSIDCIEFSVNDIVRSGFVKEYIIVKEQIVA